MEKNSRQCRQLFAGGSLQFLRQLADDIFQDFDDDFDHGVSLSLLVVDSHQCVALLDFFDLFHVECLLRFGFAAFKDNVCVRRISLLAVIGFHDVRGRCCNQIDPVILLAGVADETEHDDTFRDE